MDSSTPPGVIRYSGFLSYSSHNAREAEWLQRRIEAYSLPRGLRRQGHRRLLPLFRDVSELSAAPSLEVELKEALSASANLIVLCSPEAAASRWVNREIELFRALHPDRPVLAALCAGDAATSFPPAMCLRTDDGTAATPLAADLRHGQGGRQLAVIKLVARLANVTLDQLIQRDTQRRHRQALVVAAASLALAAVLLVALILTIRSRREAISQRAAAESLVEFMVGDLRSNLEPLGKLSILDSVGARALRYYQNQRGDNGADTLARRARVLRMVGDIQSQRGNLDIAQANFAAAADSTGQLLALAPDDPQRIFDHAQSVFYVGSAAWQRRDYDRAEAAFRSYRDLAEKLVRLEPGNPKWQPEPGYASSNLGTVFLQRGRNQSAEIAFRRALAVSVAAANADAADLSLQLDLAQSHAWLADALQRLGQAAEALDERQRELAIYERLLQADPDNRQAAFRSLNARAAKANILLDQGNVKIASTIIDEVIASAEKSYSSDPSNIASLEEWFTVSLVGSDIAGVAHQPGRAEAYLARAASLIPILARSSEPAAMEVRRARLFLSAAKLDLVKGLLLKTVADTTAAIDYLGARPDFRDRTISVIFIEALVLRIKASETANKIVSRNDRRIVQHMFLGLHERDAKLSELKLRFQLL